jgi:hypothetical protein
MDRTVELPGGPLMPPKARSTREEEPIGVQTKFERFPASIKGAFVMAGADGNPHVIHIESAHVILVPGGPAKPVPLEDRQFDVAPSRDMFVPFEVPVMDLGPGWYQFVSAVKVDGARVWTFKSRPFTIPWPRNDVRRGAMVVGGRVSAGGTEFEVERVELGADAAGVVWREAEGPDPAATAPEASAILLADGVELAAVPPFEGSKAFEPRQPGERRSVTYPVPRATRSLEVMIRLSPTKASPPLTVPLV